MRSSTSRKSQLLKNRRLYTRRRAVTIPNFLCTKLVSQQPFVIFISSSRSPRAACPDTRNSCHNTAANRRLGWKDVGTCAESTVSEVWSKVSWSGRWGECEWNLAIIVVKFPNILNMDRRRNRFNFLERGGVWVWVVVFFFRLDHPCQTLDVRGNNFKAMDERKMSLGEVCWMSRSPPGSVALQHDALPRQRLPELCSKGCCCFHILLGFRKPRSVSLKVNEAVSLSLLCRCPCFVSFQRKKGRWRAIPWPETRCTCWEQNKEAKCLAAAWSAGGTYCISREASED